MRERTRARWSWRSFLEVSVKAPSDFEWPRGRPFSQLHVFSSGKHRKDLERGFDPEVLRWARAWNPLLHSLEPPAPTLANGRQRAVSWVPNVPVAQSGSWQPLPKHLCFSVDARTTEPLRKTERTLGNVRTSFRGSLGQLCKSRARFSPGRS